MLHSKLHTKLIYTHNVMIWIANIIATDKTAYTIHISHSSISSHCSELSTTEFLQYFFNEKGNFLRLIYGCFIAFIDSRYLLLYFTIPYRGKHWRVETFVDLANYHKFAKVSSTKILCSILNNIINVQIHQRLCHQM